MKDVRLVHILSYLREAIERDGLCGETKQLLIMSLRGTHTKIIHRKGRRDLALYYYLGGKMDKLTMEDIGYFLDMEEMERQQKEEQEAKSDTDTSKED